MDKGNFGAGGGIVTFKKCPECFARLPQHATRCHACNQKVGEANQFGIAKKPFNWFGYGSAILLWALFVFFVWWAFLKNG